MSWTTPRTIACDACGNELLARSPKKRFCNWKCSRSVKFAGDPGGRLTKCKFCAKEFDTGSSRRKYCSSECKHKQTLADRIPKNKEYHLRQEYGLSLEQYDGLAEMQNGACAICHASISRGGWKYDSLVVDHNHSTGAVRGLLCRHCNTGLGFFFDRPDFLRNAADYLEANMIDNSQFGKHVQYTLDEFRRIVYGLSDDAGDFECAEQSPAAGSNADQKLRLEHSPIRLKPSEFSKVPSWCTHIVWYPKGN